MNNYGNDEKFYLDFGGENIYIDFDEIINVVRLDIPIIIDFDGEEDEEEDINEKTKIGQKTIKNKSDEDEDDEEGTRPTQYGNITIDVIKWEMINKMVNTVLDDLTEDDPTMGRKNLNKLPVSFKIAYNTLLHYNIIKILEE